MGKTRVHRTDKDYGDFMYLEIHFAPVALEQEDGERKPVQVERS